MTRIFCEDILTLRLESKFADLRKIKKLNPEDIESSGFKTRVQLHGGMFAKSVPLLRYG